MPAETIDNSNIREGDENKVEMHAENQQAEKIINAGIVYGNININNEINEVKPTNKFLCRNLIEAIQEYSPKAKNFLEMDIDDSERGSWETDESYLEKAKDILISSYASVVGDFLRNLMGSDFAKDYFGLSLAITKRTLQLICFSFVSVLWDQTKEKKQEINPEHLKLLKKLFFTGVEPSISFYGDLFKALVTVFQELKLNYPFEEIKNMEADFNGENAFLGTCKAIDAHRLKFGADQSLPPVDEIEKQLTSFLVTLNFLAHYKMVSVKNIGYEAVRNNTAQFLHTYSFIGGNSISKGDGQKYNFQEKPINSDAVILFKDTYAEGLNLFPFIIDINALKDEKLVRICFYAWNDENDKTLVYYYLNKIPFDTNAVPDEKFEYNNDFEEIEKDINNINNSADKDITGLKANDGEKFKKMKLYEVYRTFQNAKESFFGTERI